MAPFELFVSIGEDNLEWEYLVVGLAGDEGSSVTCLSDKSVLIIHNSRGVHMCVLIVFLHLTRIDIEAMSQTTHRTCVEDAPVERFDVQQ